MLSNLHNHIILVVEVLLCTKFVVGKEGARPFLGHQISSGLHHCHLHDHDYTHTHTFSHEPLFAHHDYLPQICPVIPSAPIPWTEGHKKPWTKTPVCTYSASLHHNSSFSSFSTTSGSAKSPQEPLCTFTDESVYENRGMSILTYPYIADEIISTSKAFLNSRLSQHSSGDEEDDEEEFKIHKAPSPPPFEIKNVPGKGMGVIANRTIQRGETLFAHPVIAILHNDAFATRKHREFKLRRELMMFAVTQLPSESREKFWAMIGEQRYGEERDLQGLVGRANVNTFGEEFGGQEHSVVVPETARMNHDCRPNAMYYFDRERLVHYTHASRTINAGEEITITYIDPLQSREERQKAIRQTWGFSCTCPLCTLSPALSAASDRRILAINELTPKIQSALLSSTTLSNSSTPLNTNPNHTISQNDLPTMAELLISLYQQEHLTAHIADAWTLAARVFRDAGRLWDGLRWAYLAEEGSMVYEGGESRAARRGRALVWGLRGRLGLSDDENDEDGG